MRKKTETMYYVMRSDSELSTLSNGYSDIDDLVSTECLSDGVHNILVGRIETLTVEHKTIAKFENAPARKSRTRQTARGSVTTAGDVPLKKDGTPRKKPGRKPQAEKAAKAESVPVVEARNGHNHAGEEAQS